MRATASSSPSWRSPPDELIESIDSGDSIVAMVRDRARLAPWRTALVVPTRRGYREIAYCQLVARADAIAGGLAARGLARGDRVVVFVPLGAALYELMIGVMSLGAVAVFVEAGASLAEIERVVRLVEPRVFAGVARAHALRLASPAVARVPLAVAVGVAPPLLRAVAIDELAAAGAAQRRAPDPSWPALLTFSSGTGGEPKGAIRTHAFLAAQHRAIEPYAYRADDAPGVDLTSFPVVVLSSLASGATAVVPRLERRSASMGAELVALVERHGVTTLAGAPAFVEPALAYAAERGRALTTVRRVIVGGGPVSLQLCELADRSVLPRGEMTAIYGSTEAEPIAAINADELLRDARAATRAGQGLCVGRVHHDVELAIVRVSDSPLTVRHSIAELAVEPGELGEIAVAGPHVNERYYRAPNAELRAKVREPDGRVWHRTGDVGRVDNQGRLWLAGRAADLVRLPDGRTLLPAAVEAAVQARAVVGRVALIAGSAAEPALVVSPRSTRQLVRWLLSRRRRRADRARLADRARAIGAAPARVHLAPRLPVDLRHRTKIDYRAVRRIYARRWSRWLP